MPSPYEAGWEAHIYAHNISCIERTKPKHMIMYTRIKRVHCLGLLFHNARAKAMLRCGRTPQLGPANTNKGCTVAGERHHS